MFYLLSFFLFLTLALLVFGYFTNRARVRDIPDFDLQPNCLLTRWPLVFLTGPRSFFYYKNYWNLFPIYLAEHGYEVFHLPLPWKTSPRVFEKLVRFLSENATAKRPLHLVMDTALYQEALRHVDLDQFPGLASITVIGNDSVSSTRLVPHRVAVESLVMEDGASPCLLEWSYRFHRALSGGKNLPSLAALGSASALRQRNCQKLLRHAHDLAERDLISSDTEADT